MFSNNHNSTTIQIKTQEEIDEDDFQVQMMKAIELSEHEAEM